MVDDAFPPGGIEPEHVRSQWFVHLSVVCKEGFLVELSQALLQVGVVNSNPAVRLPSLATRLREICLNHLEALPDCSVSLNVTIHRTVVKGARVDGFVSFEVFPGEEQAEH